MKIKILATAPLPTKTGLSVASNAKMKDLQGVQALENPLTRDFQASSYSTASGDGLAVGLIILGVVLALSSTVSLVHKGLMGKASAKMIEPEYKKPEENQTTIVSATSANKQTLPTTYVEKAYAFFRQGDTQKALAEFNNAIRVRPHDAYLYSERANLRRKNLEDKNGALEDYTQAINLHPDNPLFYLWRSQLYYEIGDKLKAMTDYNTAIRLAPEDTMYHSFQTNIRPR